VRCNVLQYIVAVCCSALQYLVESRSEPNFQTETKTGLYQSHRMCDQFMIFVTVTNCHKFEIVTEFVSLLFFWFFEQNRFGHILVTNVTNGHTFNCDWYKHVSVAVSIEMVRNERNTEKTYQKVSSVSVFCFESGSERL